MTVPPSVRTLPDLRARMDAFRRVGERTALIPTMGALHDGHLSLVRLARQHADRVIVSIFVNPAQFAPDEDFDAYPRDTADDLARLAGTGVDLVYLPNRAQIYADDHSTQVVVGGVGEGLETDHRPTFFHGVALIVTKLFNRVRPDIALFGEKDYQQLAVIRRLVRDLDMPVEIVGAPIARDAHGLALSSRNRYFDADGLAQARQLYAALTKARDALEGGADVAQTLATAKRDILDAGFDSVDYVTLADAASLDVHKDGVLTRPMRLLVAAHCQGVRLIDNLAVAPKPIEDSRS